MIVLQASVGVTTFFLKVCVIYINLFCHNLRCH